MAAKFCARHTGYVPTCFDCNAKNPTTMSEQESFALSNECEGYDPYNHVGSQVPMAFKSQWFNFATKGETVFYTSGRNWLQRWMIRFLFGWKVINE